MPPVGQYLRYSTVFDESASLRVLKLAAALQETRPDGVREIYPGYGSVYVEWDDVLLPDAMPWIDAAIEQPAGKLGEPREIEVPVRYGGLDTDDVAETTGLDAEEIARVHADGSYRVWARATAGQPMLAGNDERLKVPRRDNPRGDVPALSVAITGGQTTIYPLLLPGGWSVIGTALRNVYDPHDEDPFLFALGDRVKFIPQDGEPPEPPSVRELLPKEPRLPALRVEQAGAYDLVLDAGRLNQAHHGMAQSGPLDGPAADLANQLCDNPPGTTLIESALNGPTFVALRDLYVGAAGRGFVLHVDDEPVGQATTPVRKGRRLALVPTGQGVRGYLALAGGIEAEAFLGSASVDRFGLLGRQLKDGDVLGLAHERDTPPREMRAKLTHPPSHTVVRVRKGPQWSQEAQDALTSRPFAVATGDRMGVRLDGPEVPGGELLSESPPPGAVQVPAGGAPILLLADRMRSAGYDKPAVIHPADLGLAAQLRPGDQIRFAFVGDHPVPWFRDLGDSS